MTDTVSAETRAGMSDAADWLVCNECGGSGDDMEDSSKDCWNCGGSGKVRRKPEQETILSLRAERDAAIARGTLYRTRALALLRQCRALHMLERGWFDHARVYAKEADELERRLARKIKKVK